MGWQQYHGYNQWEVKWSFEWRQKGESCHIDNVAVHVEGLITLPKGVGGTSSQQAQLQKYVNALYQHELGQYRHGQQAARKIQQSLQGLRVGDTCKNLVVAANTEAERITDEFRERDKIYDKLTDHGRREGVDVAQSGSVGR